MDRKDISLVALNNIEEKKSFRSEQIFESFHKENKNEVSNAPLQNSLQQTQQLAF